ncbi:MAG TPA: ketopantoate reductase C-terminal domain-containing protein, partial [Tepidisphaeraceae bacterium]|nr:ketopantoate reductase C-terminal domain-containing protein [Tepidisphaeraceae bacterium]
GEWKQKLSEAISEACAVAKASGGEVDSANVYALFDSIAPGGSSSMQKDLAAGHQIELDAISGPIVRGGARYGIDVSTTVGLVAAIRAKIAPNKARTDNS